MGGRKEGVLKKYEVTWTELHSAFVDAEDEEIAVNNAYLLGTNETFDAVYEKDVSIREVDKSGDPINENL